MLEKMFNFLGNFYGHLVKNQNAIIAFLLVFRVYCSRLSLIKLSLNSRLVFIFIEHTSLSYQ